MPGSIETYMWIWEVSATLNGDIQAIIAKLKSIGAKGAIIKANDGASIWNQFAQAAGQMKQAGLSVGAWGYVYGADVPGEARAALHALNSGADFYVIDAETEYEGKRSQAVEFGKLLRASAPEAVISYTSFPFASLHPDFPYQEISAYCNSVYPQCYWGDIGVSPSDCVSRSYRELSHFGIPISPVGQAYRSNGKPTQEELKEFTAACESLPISRVSYWSLQSADDQLLSWIADVSLADSQQWALPYLTALSHAGILQQNHMPTEVMSFALACTIFNRTFGFGDPNRTFDPANEIAISRQAGLVRDPHSPDEIFTWNAAIAMLARAARADGGGLFQDWLYARNVLTSPHPADQHITIGELAVALTRIRNIPVST